MDTSLNSALTRLARGEFLRIRDGQGQGIAVFTGRVWITQDADRRDVILGTGESFTFDRPGLALVQALSDTSVLVFGSESTRPTQQGDVASASRVQSAATATGKAPISSYELQHVARRLRADAIGNALLSLAAAVRVWWARLLARPTAHADGVVRLATSGAGAASDGAGHGRRA